MSEKISNNKGDEPTAFMPDAISVSTDDFDDDADYQSDNDKPIILELGATSSKSMLAANAYSSEHPLDMHMASSSGGAAAYIPPAHYQWYEVSSVGNPPMLPTLGTHVTPALFTNPYMQYNSPLTPPTPPPSALTLPPVSHQLSTAARIASGGGLGAIAPVTAYPPHIPQTVSNWCQAPNAKGKAVLEVVQPPMYATYPNAPEHLIVKERNRTWREKAAQMERDYKKTACDRERTRMRDMNKAFDMLRAKLPITKPNGKKYSKIESLRIAISYIHHLLKILEKAETSNDFLPTDNANNNHEINGVTFVAELDRQRSLQEFQAEDSQNYSMLTSKDIKQESGSDVWSDNQYIGTDSEQWE